MRWARNGDRDNSVNVVMKLLFFSSSEYRCWLRQADLKNLGEDQ
jgi:hypothetical protein